MTPTERAEKMLTLVNLPGTRSAWEDKRNGLPLSSYEAVIEEIKEAQREATEKLVDRFGHVPADLIIEARDEGFRAGQDEGFKSGHATGFAAAREKAKGIAEKGIETWPCEDYESSAMARSIAQRIGKMEP